MNGHVAKVSAANGGFSAAPAGASTRYSASSHGLAPVATSKRRCAAGQPRAARTAGRSRCVSVPPGSVRRSGPNSHAVAQKGDGALKSKKVLRPLFVPGYHQHEGRGPWAP